MEKILLHTCCAPCLIYPLEALRNKGFSVTGFFYNPNIHPLEEYKKRRQAVEDYARSSGLEMIIPLYVVQEFFHKVHMKEEKEERCPICWHLRMHYAAQLAAEKGFSYFSTTLLVSPYQDQDTLFRIGSEIGRQEGVGFYYEDFRPGFKKAHEQARSLGIYCQKYCGCLYSEIEKSIAHRA